MARVCPQTASRAMMPSAGGSMEKFCGLSLGVECLAGAASGRIDSGLPVGIFRCTPLVPGVPPLCSLPELPLQGYLR